ncbi:unnamed protein product [Trifolium pratense]|uniref:Uncharacterized protein n=1 Tax=Trifolium pratense TaxID=57577 RepID=A0ACB0IWP6_TRIPR|nr:unnamed protein product [Trifolium pratense]
MALKRTDLSQNLCSPQFNDTHFNPTLFQYPQQIVNNITIYYNCNSTVSQYILENSLCGSLNPSFCYIGDDKDGFLRNCKKHIQVPVGPAFPIHADYYAYFKRDVLESGLNKGFELKYSVNQECLSCLGNSEILVENCTLKNNNDIEKLAVSSCYYDNCLSGSNVFPTNCSPLHKNSKPLSWQRKMKAIAGSASGTFVGLSICIIIIYFIYKFIKNNQEITNSDEGIEAFLKTHEGFSIRRYKFSDIKKMTNNFEVKLGQGGYGTVYRGKLINDRLVAVKILNASKGNGEDFMNEVSSITKTSHINVVALLGFCFDRRKKVLIYELMSNGSLDKFIYNNQPGAIQSLSWEILYQIAKGIARGLEYLHRGCSTRILHFDIKPHNILLDENFCPKISDFGLARLCPKKESIISMSDARGTMGYVAPELWNRNFGGVSHKSDVY